jgi:hypothetical protein
MNSVNTMFSGSFHVGQVEPNEFLVRALGIENRYTEILPGEPSLIHHPYLNAFRKRGLIILVIKHFAEA